MAYSRKVNFKYFTGASTDCFSSFFSYCYEMIFNVNFIFSELKEQLLARSSRVDEIEHLKSEFNNQKREIKEQNEAELESLRR